MADDASLSDEEREELEQLRAEKAERERQRAAVAERAELERLKADKAAVEADRAEAQRIAEAKEKGRKLMEVDEDDDDLKMPTGQKIVIAAVAVLAIALVLSMIL